MFTERPYEKSKRSPRDGNEYIINVLFSCLLKLSRTYRIKKEKKEIVLKDSKVANIIIIFTLY